MPALSRSLARRVVSVALMAALPAFAACSDDGEAIDPDADEEVIEDAILTVDDLPDGFEEADADDDEGDDLEGCAEDSGFDADALEENQVIDGEPVSFEQSTDEAFVSVGATIGSVRDTEPAEDLLALFEDDDDFLDCVFDALEQAFEDDDQEAENFDAEVIDAAVDGDASAAVRVEVEVRGFEAEIEQHLVLVGRFGVALQVVAVNEPLDEDLVEDALDVMVDRLEDAQS
jgi:hypothetical protein